MIENAKVVTQVYQSKMREEISTAINKLLQAIAEYQTKYQNKVLRLCFSTQKELYQIFTKILGMEIFK
jgi:chorismate mutase